MFPLRNVPRYRLFASPGVFPPLTSTVDAANGHSPLNRSSSRRCSSEYLSNTQLASISATVSAIAPNRWIVCRGHLAPSPCVRIAGVIWTRAVISSAPARRTSNGENSTERDALRGLEIAATVRAACCLRRASSMGRESGRALATRSEESESLPYLVMTYIVTAYIVMAYIVMAASLARRRE